MKVDFKHILCATDLSQLSNQGVFYAAELARQFEAKLSVCYVIDLPVATIHGAPYTYPPDYLDSLKQTATEQLDFLIDPLSVDREALVRFGPSAKTITLLIEEKGVDLTVVTTHGRSGIKRLFLGSVTERLVRTVTCPLLIVTPHEQTGISLHPPSLHFKNILIGCDFSADSRRALTYGLSLAQEYQATLHLVHVIESSAHLDALLPDAAAVPVQTTTEEEVIDRLHRLVPEDARQWCDVKLNAPAGRPYEQLIKYAGSASVDLIIMGVRGHGLMETMLLGATTDRVIRRSSCPVLSVSPVD